MDRFFVNPNLDWGFYLITGVSYMCIFGYAHLFYHAAIQKFWFER